MKELTEQMIDDIIKLKFGRLVDEAGHTSFVSNRILGKIFGMSGEKIRRAYLARFAKNAMRTASLMERLQIS